MDPNANLQEQLAIAAEIAEIDDESLESITIKAEHAERLAELVTALNNWIAAGGFLPTAWNRNR